MLQAGPALIDALLPGAALLERARALPDAAAWEARVQEALDHRAGAPSQAFLFDQVTRVLQALARDHPLLLILDDLQWADTASISLLFHLGRRLAGHRILVLGAYRPEEVAAGREGQPHPLAAGAARARGAVGGERRWTWPRPRGAPSWRRWWIASRTGWAPAFREALYRHTGGPRPVHAWSCCAACSSAATCVRDAEGRWMEGPALDWERLPKRVEAVIAAHIARLPREEQELLSVASVEGEEFHAEVAARVLRDGRTGGAGRAERAAEPRSIAW